MIRAELLMGLRSRQTHLVFAVYLVAMVAMTIVDAVMGYRLTQQYQPDQGSLRQIASTVSPQAMLASLGRSMIGIGAVAVQVVSSLQVGSDFSWHTLTTKLTSGRTRGEVYRAKIVSGVIVGLIQWLVPTVLLLPVGLVLWVMWGAPAPGLSVGRAVATWLVGGVAAAFWGCVAGGLTLALRSTRAAVFVLFSWVVAVERIIGFLADSGSWAGSGTSGSSVRAILPVSAWGELFPGSFESADVRVICVASLAAWAAGSLWLGWRRWRHLRVL